MLRRLTVLLLIGILSVANVARGLCPSGGCPLPALSSMDCCQRGGWTKPSCCDRAQVGAAVAGAAATVRPVDGVAPMASHAVSIAYHATPPATVPALPPSIGSLAPPGTLIAQHTALLL